MLQLRNQAPLEPKENKIEVYGVNEPRKTGSNPHTDDPYHTDSSASISSDDEENTKGKKNGKRKDDEGLLVRSTISRDTTQNTPTVDSIDLSKMAAQTGDLPLNVRDSQKPSASPLRVAPPPPPPTFYLGTRTNPQPPPPQTLIRPPLPAFNLNLGHTGPPAATSILAKIRPGRDLRTLYLETWSDKSRYATYNWPDKLRVATRRKSESNLDIYRETSDDSVISQYLPPNASKRRLVARWKTAGHQIEQESEGGPFQRPVDDRPSRDMGANLGRMSERHLGLDLYDDSPQSMFFSHLLDTIEALRAERNFYEDLLIRPQIIRPPPANAPESDSELKAIPEFKILHRVFCKSQMHSHDQVVFEDAPVRVFSERSQDLALSAKTIVRNLDHYCSQHPNISFIIFKEYLCVEDSAPRARFDNYERRNRAGAEISPRAQRMCIVSDILKKALYHVASCSLLQSRISSRGMQEMAAPYLFLYHHREALRQYEKEVTGLVRENVSLLLDFLDSDYDSEYREADAEFAKGILTVKHIEKLYRPNEIVIERTGAHDLAYMVREWPEIVENEMKVSCWSWQYDGMFLQRQDTILKIKLPLPENYTTDNLPFCPISMASDAVIETLKERGKKFWSMKTQYFCCFSGLDINKIQFHHHIRIVVDMFTYSKMHASKVTPPSLLEASRFDPWPNKIPREDELDDSMVLLLPPHVFGFMLQEKQWLKLDINGIHPIEWNKRAFDRLVLDPKTKELITALVEVRIKTGRAEDIIGGKGNGLMILLHGGPGTGKTLTAESVAEIAEKPLYRVTCGDIGTKADDVEKYLQTVLYLGKIWNCVLLLDEADIFLEERTIADLERNSLVSVFLRILEYYDGILIMTSNRVGTFDEAFKSRIQVSLHYEDLTKKARQTIWNNFIVMLEEAGEDVNISDLESHLEEIASEEMNGRQIRNAMTTARQLALHRKERLHWEHLDQVLKTAREFNRYLKNVQGHTDKQWAREQRLR